MEHSVKVKQFHHKVFDWWEQENHHRQLPWRTYDQPQTPYYVLLSEFMLQQTQVSRVVTKFNEFLDTYPTLHDLAVGAKSDVISLWQGLGYNRRAIWLHDAAITLDEMDQYPRHWKEWIKIKGIGPYSARSIPIFAFNKNFAAVDTNIRRIYIHEGFIDEDMSKKEIQAVADQLIPAGKSRAYHNALMDYGSTHLTSSKTGIKSTSTQKPFEGSTRQYRGKIVSYLTEQHAASIEEICESIGINQKHCQKLLNALVTDGLVSYQKNEGFSLPE